MFFKIVSVVLFYLFLSVYGLAVAQKTENGKEDSSVTKNVSGQKVDRIEFMNKTLHARWENVQRILKEDPDNIKMLVEGGRIARLVREKKKAIGYYKRAVSLMRKSPNTPEKSIVDLQRTIIGLYTKLPNINMAIVEFKKLHNMFPDNYDIHLKFADFLRNNGFPRRAFIEYQKILEKKDDDLAVIDKIMQLYAQGHISKEELQKYMDK